VTFNLHKTFSYKALRRLVAVFCFSILFFNTSFSQKTYWLQTNFSAEDAKNKLDTLAHIFSDTFSLKKALLNWQQAAFAKSYFEASVDKLEQKDSIFFATLHIGKPYEWLNLKKGNVNNNILDKVGFRQKKYRKTAFSFQDATILQERIISYLENHGYPFASVRLDSVSIEKQKVEASLFLQKGKLVYFDGIELEDDSVKISPRYIENYLGVSPKTIFEHGKIKNAKARLAELPFLSLVGEPYLSFSDDKAKVKMLLKKNRASRFDAVLGLLPSNASAAEQRKLAVTGTLNLDLQNSLGKGERFLVDFQRLKAETQELKIQANYPYIFNYNIGIDASLNIFKGASFTEIKINTGLQYLFSGNNFIKIFRAQLLTNTNLSSADSAEIVLNRRLPERLDVDATAYGIELVKQHLDYRFNPRKGWSLQMKGDIGNRTIRKSNKITGYSDPNDPSFVFESLYDTLKLRTLRLQSNFVFDVYLPLFQQSTIKISAQGAGLFTQTPIYQNEQYRIGGNRVLRGFNEASIYATRYGILTLEYRFLFGQNSYFNVFSDAAYIENKTSRQNLIERPISIGAGMAFETRAGLFSIVYALGKPTNSPFDLRSGKIHFGYVNLF
jgi:hypothetical protein